MGLNCSSILCKVAALVCLQKTWKQLAKTECNVYIQCVSKKHPQHFCCNFRKHCRIFI